MRTLSVSASSDYLVEIAPGLLDALGERTVKLLPRAQIAVIVSDEHVFPLHGERADKFSFHFFSSSEFICDPSQALPSATMYINRRSVLCQCFDFTALVRVVGKHFRHLL